MKENLRTNFLTRQYMVSDDFEIFYYHNSATPPPMHLHRHDFYELYFFMEGNAKIQLQDDFFLMNPGDLFIIPPGVPHQSILADMKVPYSRFVLWVSKAYFQSLRSISPDFLYGVDYVQSTHAYMFHNDKVTFNAISSRIFRLIEEQRSKQFGHEAQSRVCLDDLILFLNRIIYNQLHPDSSAVSETLHENIVSYIETHLSEKLSLEELSQKFYASKFHIAHIFKEKHGISIHQYISKRRLYACREAIESGGSISEISRHFGFSDYSCFYRAFKKEFGLAPKECQDMICLKCDNETP